MNKKMPGLSERYELVNDMPRYATDLRVVGTAYKNTEEDHYVVRLRVFPFIKYFLRAKGNGSEDLLLYSGIDQRGDELKLFNVMGQGEMIGDEYVKLTFYDIGLICYMRLSPKDYHYTHQAIA